MVATLLGLALQVLIASQQPNVPIDLKNKAVSVAILAIEMAKNTPTESKNTPLFGSVSPVSTTTVEVLPQIVLEVIPNNTPITPCDTKNLELTVGMEKAKEIMCSGATGIGG